MLGGKYPILWAKIPNPRINITDPRSDNPNPRFRIYCLLNLNKYNSNPPPKPNQSNTVFHLYYTYEWWCYYGFVKDGVVPLDEYIHYY